jgi:hypothetical protein
MHQGRATSPLLGGLVLVRAGTLAEPFTSAQLSILQQVPYFNEQLDFRGGLGCRSPGGFSCFSVLMALIARHSNHATIRKLRPTVRN